MWTVHEGQRVSRMVFCVAYKELRQQLLGLPLHTKIARVVEISEIWGKALFRLDDCCLPHVHWDCKPRKPHESFTLQQPFRSHRLARKAAKDFKGAQGIKPSPSRNS